MDPDVYTGWGTGHVKVWVGDAIKYGQFRSLKGPKLEKRKSRDAKRRRDIAMVMESTVVKLWLQDHTVTDIAVRMKSTIPIINGVLRRFRTQQLEANEESKEQLVADQIAKLKRISVELQAEIDEVDNEGNKVLSVGMRLKTYNQMRQLQKDISELLGLTRGTVVHNIKEMKLYDIDLTTFPQPGKAVTGIGEAAKMLEVAAVVLPDKDEPETFKDQHTVYEEELKEPSERVFLPDGSSVPRVEVREAVEAD